MGRKSRLEVALALVVSTGLVVSACAGASSPTPDANATVPATAPPPATTGATRTAASPAWAKLDQRLARLGPHVGFLAARVVPGGTCEPIHEVAAATPRPTASQFKLFVLGALVGDIAAGQVSWDQTLTIEDATKSAGNGEGSLQAAAPGTTVSVEEAATKMISISDNTAADMLLGLIGRDDVEAQNRAWSAHASANVPFLTTRQMLLLHYVPDLGARYLATSPDRRADFLATSVDPRRVTDIGLGLTAEPRDIDTIEWFASPDDICRAFAGLQEQSKGAAATPLPAVLSREVAGIGLDRGTWPIVWFKGGSEPGVLTLGWLATNGNGETFVVEAMVSDPAAALAPDSITDLVDLGREAFGLLS